MTEVMFATILPRTLAAVRQRTNTSNVGGTFRRALDKVWAFLGVHPGLREDGHNVMLYHHEPPDGHFNSPRGLEVDFGVEVVRTFADEGEVRCIETPTGEAAIAMHRGPYHNMFATHQAIHAAIAQQGRRIGSHSIEIYGDHNDDPAKLEVEIIYLLA